MKRLVSKAVAGVIIVLLCIMLAPCVALAGDNSEEEYVVTLTAASTTSSSITAPVSGGGDYHAGTRITVIAYSRKGYSFIGWYEAEDTGFTNRISSRQDYTFTVNSDRNLVALYEKVSGISFKLEVAASRFRINNGRIQTDGITNYYNAGDKMFLSFADDSMNFQYWVNKSGYIVSTAGDYSFVLSGDTELTAYYSPKSDNGNQAVVYFRNALSS